MTDTKILLRYPIATSEKNRCANFIITCSYHVTIIQANLACFDFKCLIL